MSWLHASDAAFLRMLATAVKSGDLRDDERLAISDRLEIIADLTVRPADDHQLRPVDPIGKPAHYARGQGAFVQDHCDAYELRCREAPDLQLPQGTVRFLGGMEHNAGKYMWRAGEKAQLGKSVAEATLRDWEAAAWYVTRGVTHLKALVAKLQPKKD